MLCVGPLTRSLRLLKASKTGNVGPAFFCFDPTARPPTKREIKLDQKELITGSPGPKGDLFGFNRIDMHCQTKF